MSLWVKFLDLGSENSYDHALSKNNETSGHGIDKIGEGQKINFHLRRLSYTKVKNFPTRDCIWQEVKDQIEKGKWISNYTENKCIKRYGVRRSGRQQAIFFSWYDFSDNKGKGKCIYVFTPRRMEKLVETLTNFTLGPRDFL